MRRKGVYRRDVLREKILQQAQESFPNKKIHFRYLGGVREIVVSELRLPKQSLSDPIETKRYEVSVENDNISFIPYVQ